MLYAKLIKFCEKWQSCTNVQTHIQTDTDTHTHARVQVHMYVHTYKYTYRTNNLTFGKFFRIERKRKQPELASDFYFVTGLISSISLQTDSCTGGSYPSGRSTFAPGSSLPAFPSPWSSSNFDNSNRGFFSTFTWKWRDLVSRMMSKQQVKTQVLKAEWGHGTYCT